jgi:hypothetical protein
MRAKQKWSGASDVQATQRDADTAKEVQISRACEKANCVQLTVRLMKTGTTKTAHHEMSSAVVWLFGCLVVWLFGCLVVYSVSLPLCLSASLSALSLSHSVSVSLFSHARNLRKKVNRMASELKPIALARSASRACSTAEGASSTPTGSTLTCCTVSTDTNSPPINQTASNQQGSAAGVT